MPQAEAEHRVRRAGHGPCIPEDGNGQRSRGSRGGNLRTISTMSARVGTPCPVGLWPDPSPAWYEYILQTQLAWQPGSPGPVPSLSWAVGKYSPSPDQGCQGSPCQRPDCPSYLRWERTPERGWTARVAPGCQCCCLPDTPWNPQNPPASLFKGNHLFGCAQGERPAGACRSTAMISYTSGRGS